MVQPDDRAEEERRVEGSHGQQRGVSRIRAKAMTRWTRTLDLADVFHADLPFIEKRDEMVKRIRVLDPDSVEVQDLAEELGDAEDEDEWDMTWDVFYDWADANRVWVQTW